MGETASKELASDNQPSRLKDINEKLHDVMIDLLQERATVEAIKEKREELEKERLANPMAYHQQVQALLGNNTNSPSASLSKSSALQMFQQQLPSLGLQQQQQQQTADGNTAGGDVDPFPAKPIPTLGIAIELRNKTAAAGSAELVETIHRIWVALTVPGAGLGDSGCTEAANALTRAAHLELLDLAYNDIGPNGLSHICPALSSCEAGKNCLTFVRFSGNPIGTSGIKHVAEFAQNAPQLEELQLYNCDITDEGVLLLANSLKLHDNIRVVNLAKNKTTRKSVLILTELAKRAKTLLHVNIDCSGSGDVKESDYPLLEEALEKNRADARRREEHRAMLQAKRVRREQQQLEEARQREEAAREEREQVEAKLRELEAAQRQQEDDVRRLEALAAEKEALTLAKRKHQRAAESTEALERAMNQAYDWRNKLGVATGKAAIYRDGFSLYTRQQFVERDGSLREEMVPFERNPKRLKACWCDPPDAAVPYARKLHYHCKYENANVDLVGAAKDLTDTSKFTSTDLPRYQGCRGSGHVCMSVGSYSKPLPNKTAAYFFSSQHPSFAEEEEMMMQQQHQGYG